MFSNSARAEEEIARVEEKTLFSEESFLVDDGAASAKGLVEFVKEEKVLTKVATLSAETGQSPWMLNLWGLSHHPYTTHKFNERNWGVGIRYDHQWNMFGERWFSEANAVKNSVRGLALTLGSGAEYKVAEMGGLSLYLGGMASLMSYEHPIKHKTYYGMIAGPTVAIEAPNKMNLRMLVIPSSDRKRPVTAHVFYISVPFDAFFNKAK
ncbi:MAG: hypothetical protein A3C93_04115 [Candidatus Lloydbacteria bacterium RIFCSPHIGHO2_02_FULL_54_17]|uniref:DUF3575 domain-containing protein n=1 Tax=Candidatus Lloydbacteria bacterium RIFCSPHIGHO2_02_FULL_54_17 TaxID=1798664 RepID=A0A1G2DBG4_9BACT|nr:MAG: hypothetical protein A3C93_04115 [Candidatus Lloydbacteria bacterium RIFCSPHIGHO2_02_FULL_54_17]OGZ14798.1 MAG: hypothetical protein A2948_02920 [Candidatus Lloydbacteria bacterium RIFCSPLOWO2_01_FULL_54_18]OGZ16834.1 MAG: hypothetical protein A3H76_00845 [Candidatus Lloydbacteria bacterium RIFCSPLOWO2_02_FULL_54_12]